MARGGDSGRNPGRISTLGLHITRIRASDRASMSDTLPTPNYYGGMLAQYSCRLAVTGEVCRFVAASVASGRFWNFSEVICAAPGLPPSLSWQGGSSESRAGLPIPCRSASHK